MKREAIGHTKMRRLCIYLDCPGYVAVGILESLWHLTAREAPAGDIGRLSSEEIAIGIDYRGDPDALITALFRARWLDRHPDNGLMVHDWWEHADDTVHAKLARARRYFADGRIPKLTKLSRFEREEASLWYSAHDGIPEPQNGILWNPPENADGSLPEPCQSQSQSQSQSPASYGRGVPNGADSLPKPSPVLNGDWFEFRETAESAGISGSTDDWREAWMLWRTRDPAQRQAATDGIRIRAGTDDPALKALPQNYIRRQMWERKIREPSALNGKSERSLAWEKA